MSTWDLAIKFADLVKRYDPKSKEDFKKDDEQTLIEVMVEAGFGHMGLLRENLRGPHGIINMNCPYLAVDKKYAQHNKATAWLDKIFAMAMRTRDQDMAAQLVQNEIERIKNKV